MNINIVTTKFENLKTDGVHFGFRIYTDNGVSYDNIFFEDEKEAKECKPLDMLRDIAANPANDEISEMMDTIESLQLGVSIDDEEYTWDEIEDCFR